ncbi:MAG: DUF4974 domain-containing protein [Gemmataceae bacterium]|nr:DUF4974 domain-containing protein [Gemmataceae bacterium]
MRALWRGFVVAVLGVGVVAGSGDAQQKKHAFSAVQRQLNDLIDMKDFQQNMTLKECLGLLIEKFQAKGVNLAIRLDAEAFKDDNPDCKDDVWDSPVKFPQYPKQMTLATALRVALAQIPSRNASYLIRDGHVEITTHCRAAPARLLQETVLGDFRDERLRDVLDNLADQTGATIVIDKRAKEKADTTLTVSFRNSITLETAAKLVAHMADLRVVIAGDVIYVTRPEDAARFKEEKADAVQ